MEYNTFYYLLTICSIGYNKETTRRRESKTHIVGTNLLGRYKANGVEFSGG